MRRLTINLAVYCDWTSYFSPRLPYSFLDNPIPLIVLSCHLCEVVYIIYRSCDEFIFTQHELNQTITGRVT